MRLLDINKEEEVKTGRIWMVALVVTAVTLSMGLAVVLAASVTPETVSPWQSGNAQFECSKVGTYMYAYKIDNWDTVDENGTYTATFPYGHSNNITITNSDGTYFDWSASPNPIGAVIVKGGNAANVFKYDPQAYSDTHLYAPNNASGKPAKVSHTTFCWNPQAECFAYETAWADGVPYVERGNWATYTGYEGEWEQVTLYAGQTMEAGTVTFEPVDGDVKITIQLDQGWTFGDTNGGETVHIQGYDTTPPSENPAPGRFQYKYFATGSSFEATVDPANFYGVHAALKHQVECAQ